MRLEPSFSSLYRRSRYLRLADDQAKGPRQNQRELFAVAVVAFALKYHVEFRLHFLQAICGTSGSEQSLIRIEVQPHNHSDLAIKDAANSTLFVVEFKTGARLGPKQDPACEKEFFGDGGYGTLIHLEADYKLFQWKHYIVLDDYKTFEDGERGGLMCKSRAWAELDGGRPGTIWDDVLDSLGDLGVPAFQFQRLKNMHLTQHTKTAATMHATLASVASRLEFTNGGEDIRLDGENAWYGLNISIKPLRGFDALRACVQESKGPLAWFGYQSGTDNFERAIWFYCSSGEAAKTTHQFVLDRISDRLGKLDIEESNVWIMSDQQHIGDAEWFDAVFKALSDQPTPVS